MAKRLGSSNDDKVVPLNPNAEARRAQQENVTQETFLTAVREIAGVNAEVRALNEKRKAIRKKWKAEGLELGILDATIKMAEWDRAEVRAEFDNRRRYAEWLGLPIGTQQDLFARGDDAVQKSEWRALGRVASRLGKPARHPDECPPEYVQDWLAGFNDEDEEAWSDAERADAQMKAAEGIEVKPGNVAEIAKALEAKPAGRKAKGARDLKDASFDDSQPKPGALTVGDLKSGDPADDEDEDADASPAVVH